MTHTLPTPEQNSLSSGLHQKAWPTTSSPLSLMSGVRICNYELMQIIVFFSRAVKWGHCETFQEGVYSLVWAILFYELVRVQGLISTKSVFEWSTEDADLALYVWIVAKYENKGYCSVYGNVWNGAGGHQYYCLDRILAQNDEAIYCYVARTFLTMSRRKASIWFIVC